MDEFTICKDCLKNYKNIVILNKNPITRIATKSAEDGINIRLTKEFKCKICNKWQECK